MKMNAREQILIIVLMSVVILLGGFKLLIEPSVKSYAKVKADYKAALVKQDTANRNVLEAENTLITNENITKDIAKLATPFLPELKSDNINILFKTFADKVGVSYSIINMSTPVVAQISNPVISNSEITYPAKEAANGIDGAPAPSNTPGKSGGNTTTEGTKQSIDSVEMMTVTVEIKGNYAQALALLDEIKNSGKTMRVTSVNISQDKGTAVASIITECFGVKKFTDIK